MQLLTFAQLGNHLATRGRTIHPLLCGQSERRRNIPVPDIGWLGIDQSAMSANHVRYLGGGCGHFRRAEIGNDDAGNFKDTTRSGQRGNN